MGPWSDPKSEFSGTEGPDPDPRESQKCLLGWLSRLCHTQMTEPYLCRLALKFIESVIVRTHFDKKLLFSSEETVLIFLAMTLAQLTSVVYLIAKYSTHLWTLGLKSYVHCI